MVQDYLHTRIFEPLGMKSMVPEFDASGTLIGGSLIHGTLRDWGKFGEFLREASAVLRASYDHAVTVFQARLAEYCQQLCDWSPITLRLLKRGMVKSMETTDMEIQLRYEVAKGVDDEAVLMAAVSYLPGEVQETYLNFNQGGPRFTAAATPALPGAPRPVRHATALPAPVRSLKIGETEETYLVKMLVVPDESAR